MRLLLDTHVLLWALTARRRLPKRLLTTLAEPDTEVLFSAISIREIAIKRAHGRPVFAFSPDDVLDAAVDAGFVELPVKAVHAARSGDLPPRHADPFDRLLVAQALCEPARLVTADTVFQRYPAPIEFFTPLGD
ncbi:type II toxin-antitoxin system VapC family toxin [Azohydromonas sediminis]|uniref:type II toxin-antitoxin system VapC family toxin n=1 Tax=Azohydromonas sediminis TaxID=2259674 RepID=UPI000E65E7AB|nr:type II toxin-antitoxin system VapC family toxin [Azohydromonas sediminis]